MEIYLRPLRASDAQDYADAVQETLLQLQPWMVWAHENYSAQEAVAWFSWLDQQREKGEANEMGIFSKEDDRFLGAAGIRYAQDPMELSAIGYWVRAREQRKGVAHNAVRQLAQEGFSHPGIDTIEILAAETNIASRAVARSCGAHLSEMRYGLIVLADGPVMTAIYHLRREDMLGD
ncbi:GNAT family N-acetyltransferase [Mixta intestinalis]|uniref:N-acetyltransferase domain-containing protein n=1 Tax=Mixta intestinalis TaxID=1615494 RepID=A0A6P1PZU4_9GAMM|nr:GNAT family N-acetyltransferase [Mixta intestinalis]QHM72186.1 hypothetical protein C7M51_02491 [Mixta intestinalis]